MATPALQAIRGGFPDAHIIGIMTAGIRELIEGAWSGDPPWIDDCVIYHKRSQRIPAQRGGSPLSRWHLAGELRQRRLDAIVLLTNSWWSAAVSRCAGIKSIVGYDRDARGLLLTDPIAVPRDERGAKRPISAVDYYLELARWLGAETRSRQMRLATGQEDNLLVEKLWQRVGFCISRQTIVINNAAAKDVTRVWPAERARELALRLACEYSLQVLIHCGPSEREGANRIAAEANHPLVASMGMADSLPMGLSRGVLRRADVVVSTDSGARHMAVALDRPVVALFGPTNPQWTRTYNVPESIIAETLQCRPCYQSRCPLQHHRCMRDIEVGQVLGAVIQQLFHARFHTQAGLAA